MLIHFFCFGNNNTTHEMNASLWLYCNVFCDNTQDESDGLSVTLGIAAATGLGLLAFSEVWFLNNVRHQYVRSYFRG